MNDFLHDPLFGLALTIGAYAAARAIHRRVRWLHPILSSSAIILIVLGLLRFNIADYQSEIGMLTVLLGPATVALGVPIYKHRRLIRERMKSVFVSVLAGSVTGIASAALLVYIARGSHEVLLSMLPKSVSSPIGIEISRTLGGTPELSVMFSVVTGVLGGVAGPLFLRRAGLGDPVSFGLAMGGAAHGFGTARSLQESETAGSFSALAMGLSGIVTSILFIPLYLWLG
ncbi:LrgB family protein [Saccharibacillus sp. CPCC 101409]|uniref:LrgB family protein n=1 Tax=Saccharibacillus sp. CPCC 101409 TaxID=3058041 RepID=UPI0026732BBB|nr:LrgB family protein [Saccharibacillus sp. CPCC 101409]MDO3412256.1 LrgB family protein [Saccharibacillus sp. CPCC 101409]